jgi:hypothetical protein
MVTGSPGACTAPSGPTGRPQVVAREVGAPAREEPGGEPDQRRDVHGVVEVLVVADEPVRRRISTLARSSPAGRAEHPGAPAAGVGHPEQYVDRGRLAGAVASEEAADRPRRDLEV